MKNAQGIYQNWKLPNKVKNELKVNSAVLSKYLSDLQIPTVKVILTNELFFKSDFRKYKIRM